MSSRKRFSDLTDEKIPELPKEGERVKVTKPLVQPSAAGEQNRPATDPKPQKKSKVETVEIVNKTNTMKTFNLPAETSLTRKFPVIRVLKNKSTVGEFVGKRCPDSLTLLAKERKTIPKSYLSAPEIQNAIRAKKVVVVENRA